MVSHEFEKLIKVKMVHLIVSTQASFLVDYGISSSKTQSQKAFSMEVKKTTSFSSKFLNAIK